jgi:hypothetical protein
LQGQQQRQAFSRSLPKLFCCIGLYGGRERNPILAHICYVERTCILPHHAWIGYSFYYASGLPAPAHFSPYESTVIWSSIFFKAVQVLQQLDEKEANAREQIKTIAQLRYLVFRRILPLDVVELKKNVSLAFPHGVTHPLFQIRGKDPGILASRWNAKN